MFVADRSVRGRRWRAPQEIPFVAPKGVQGAPAGIAARRGVQDLEAFFRPRFSQAMPRPDALTDMVRAAQRTADAIAAGERIGIVGDYDVDGATSTAVVVRYLESVGHTNLVWRIPRRIEEGYGINSDLVRTMHEGGVRLLVVLDSGTTAIEPIACARALGVDVVVIDHHELGDGIPDAIFVNPKRSDRDRPFDFLCSAGLAFLFVAALTAVLTERGHFARRSPPDLRSLLGLVALGTIADVVPLVGLNRVLVSTGLPILRENLGIQALLLATSEQEVTTRSCGFVLGPCINAAGRIDDMRIGVDLLLARDAAVAEELAQRLYQLNLDRRAMQQAAVESALARVEGGDSGRAGAIVLRDENWHPGIVGLVAARVREAFDRPALIIGADGKGSARSVDGFHVGAPVLSAVDRGLMLKGGGHAAAAGFTARADVESGTIKDHFDAAMEGFVAPPVTVDLVVSPGGLYPGLVHSFSAIEPFGQGNPRPRVVVAKGTVRKVEVLKGKHIKAWLSGPDGETSAMAFNAVGTPLGRSLIASEGYAVDAMGTADVNAWRGTETAYLKIEDVMVEAVVGARVQEAA